ncbi:hypothetical protein diail_1917 [Diaporthe ilicicola]|nr:hypothetical protein diail_1917 [Diaporthe ilicicola]
MRSGPIAIALAGLAGSAIAAPAPGPQITPAPSLAELEERDLIGGLLGGVLGPVLSDVNSAVSAGDMVALTSAMRNVTATATPTDISHASATLAAIQSASPANIMEFTAALAANGLVANSIDSLLTSVLGQFTGANSLTNSNANPKTPVYPKKGACDAPYSLSETALRQAIHIPSNFTYGSKPPVILFPGTGNTGYQTFSGNLIPLLTGVSYADPVWVNVPGQLLNDAQSNAEYAAYAINYIASLTSRNVSMIAWSQGNIDSQWAYKYWPSTRLVTSDHIAISPDYKGTVLADFAVLTGLTNDPSVLQQEYFSKFITTLRSNDGDSGYVPTTVLYSGFFDEIVEPQQGTGASAYLLDARGVGVTNTEVQLVCPGGVAGSFYTHEGMLYNPITFALVQDALTHAGPGMTSRINLGALCTQYLATGLNLGNFLATENAIVIAGLSLVLYTPKLAVEPSISAYATASSTCATSASRTSTVLSTVANKGASVTTTTVAPQKPTSTTSIKKTTTTTTSSKRH